MTGEFDAARHSDLQSQLRASSGGGGADQGHFDSAATKAVENAGKLLGVNAGALLNTGVAKAIGGDTQGLMAKMINEAANSLSRKGGFLAALAAQILDIQNLFKNIGGVNIESVAMESLGTFSAPTVGGKMNAGVSYSMDGLA